MKLLAIAVAFVALCSVRAQTTVPDESTNRPTPAICVTFPREEGTTEVEENVSTVDPRVPTATEEPSTTTEDSTQSSTVCECKMTTGLLGSNSISVNDLANATVTGFKRSADECDVKTFTDCREDCKLMVPVFTHDFDLTVAPFTRRDSKEKSLGARICSKVGTQAYFARVGLRAEVRCNVKSTSSRATYTSGNLMSSKQRLSCVAGLPVVAPF